MSWVCLPNEQAGFLYSIRLSFLSLDSKRSVVLICFSGQWQKQTNIGLKVIGESKNEIVTLQRRGTPLPWWPPWSKIPWWWVKWQGLWEKKSEKNNAESFGYKRIRMNKCWKLWCCWCWGWSWWLMTMSMTTVKIMTTSQLYVSRGPIHRRYLLKFSSDMLPPIP